MRVTRKIFTRAATNLFFLTNLTLSLHWKDYSNSTFLCWKTKSPIFYYLKRKKRQVVWINFLVENRLNHEF